MRALGARSSGFVLLPCRLSYRLTHAFGRGNLEFIAIGFLCLGKHVRQ